MHCNLFMAFIVFVFANKRAMIAEENELVKICHQLKMQAAYGKVY